MKLSHNWLRRYVDLTWDATTLAERLTRTGTEVEGVFQVERGAEGILVGHIVEVRPHPAADRLRVATVELGQRRAEVVCGAPNCRPGLTVAYAGEGVTLPGGLTLTRSAIRGVFSEGMLCSEAELGLSDHHEGILELPSNLTPGTPLSEVVEPRDDILELGVTPNRGDCLSVIGVAREVAAITGGSVRLPPVDEIPRAPRSDRFSIDIRSEDDCGRYLGRVIRGLRVGPSPLWLRQLLLSVGLRPINNLVDVTNYVLFECGQPLHAFDLDRLTGDVITVRRATDGEALVTLDEQPRVLTPDDLVIADASGPIALAGVMGGLSTEVTGETRAVFLEGAHFDPRRVRMTARRLGLRSESSHRFERGVDAERVAWALDRAAELMVALSAPGGDPRIEADPPTRIVRATRPITFAFDSARTVRLLGFDIPARRQREALERLGFGVSPNTDGGWAVTVPSHRHDVREPADLIEEVLRLLGHDTIPDAAPRVTSGELAGRSRALLRRKAQRFLAAHGLSQALNYSFHSRELDERFASGPTLALRNPLSEEQRVLRRTLSARLVSNAEHNLRHGAQSVALFEMGRVFEASADASAAPHEREMLGVVLAGQVPAHWSRPGRAWDFFDIKGLVEDLADHLEVPASDWRRSSDCAWLHPNAAAEWVRNGETLGRIGLLHPQVRRAFDLDTVVAIAELDVGALFGSETRQRRFAEFSRFPAVCRDTALRLANEVTAAQVLETIAALGIQLVDSVEIFDVYRGGTLSTSEYSLGVRVTYRAVGRTLTDDEVASAHGRIVHELQAAFGAERR